MGHTHTHRINYNVLSSCREGLALLVKKVFLVEEGRPTRKEGRKDGRREDTTKI